MSRKKTVMRGVLHLWSETGTEGGYWAFQDERFITPNTSRFSCTACGAYWDTSDGSDGPHVDTLPEAQRISPLTGQHSYCPPGTHTFELVCPADWSYEGLHVLEDGDELTIHDKDDRSKVVWKGTISLRRHDLFTEDASGYWIHADQNGIDRRTWSEWFFGGYPAELVKKKLR